MSVPPSLSQAARVSSGKHSYVLTFGGLYGSYPLVDHQMKNDVYCTLGDPPTECIIKYHNIGGTMTCSTKWRRSFSVVCGDACAWTEDAFWGSDAGARLGPGLAAIIYAMIFF